MERVIKMERYKIIYTHKGIRESVEVYGEQSMKNVWYMLHKLQRVTEDYGHVSVLCWDGYYQNWERFM